ncbi:sentrin-specific protease 7 isoform X2 [Clupea harengus]|uniref:Sentrin-specific protease 7 isoform X2 n=1 Tax=Clupea harengus TaxID=7950 RepID=A0A6P8GBU9_CLUHA|nr:sentrin-specific protease 7 isoform X2 [Clupea harengus]
MGGVKALANGKVEITDENITFPLKDFSGAGLTVDMATANLCRYSLLDAHGLQSSGLAQQGEAPPPSMLLLWVSKDQARQLHSDLSVIQPGTRPVEGSACVCVCLHESVSVLRVEQAMLASILDIVGLRLGNSQLLSPLAPSESLQAIRTSGDTTHTSGDTHLLKLLAPQDLLQGHTDAQPTASAHKEPEPIYTVLHSCHQGRYSVRIAKPGPEWIPYKHNGPVRRLIQFPPPPCKGAIGVTTEDLECLDSGQFLNDVIIDFYLKYLLVERTPKEFVEKCHVFSSFFYKQLTRRDNANEDSTSTTAEHRRHQRVKTWTRNVDIFSKDFLFVPVNQENHWYLVVICFPGLEEPQCEAFQGPAVVRASGEEGSSEAPPEPQAQEASPDAPAPSEADRETMEPIEESSSSPPDCTEKTCKRPKVCKRPCILIMDSLKLSIHKRVVKLLREYLQVEWEVRRGVCRDFSPEVMVGSSCKVPLQDNSSDCGLYLLHYAETFLQDPVVHFDLPLRLERWFPRQQVRRKRDEIRNLILRLCRFQSGMMGNVVPRGTTAAH